MGRRSCEWVRAPRRLNNLHTTWYDSYVKYFLVYGCKDILFNIKQLRPCFQVGPYHLGAQLPCRREAAPQIPVSEIRFHDGQQLPVSEPQKGRDDLIALAAN